MRTIAIVAGGDSSEYEVSVKSAAEVSKVLSGRYVTYTIIIRGSNWYYEDPKGKAVAVDRNDFSLSIGDRKIRFDAVFIAIHGTPGENGLLQGYFDMIDIPYTSCNAFCSALTFNKQACKLYLKEYGIVMADAVLLRTGQPFRQGDILKRVGLPCFVKPNDSGSSFGVSKVKNPDGLIPAIKEAFKESDEVLLESFMNGTEVACGVVKTKAGAIVLPVTEIVSKNEFFDYEAKYTPGMSEEITPARLSPGVTFLVQKLSSDIYDYLGCTGIVRIDFIIVDDKPWFLEVNTVPGMTVESLIPQQAKVHGLPLEELYSSVIEDLF